MTVEKSFYKAKEFYLFISRSVFLSVPYSHFEKEMQCYLFINF